MHYATLNTVQLHNISSLRNKYYILFIPSGINTFIFFSWNKYNVIIVPVGTNTMKKFFLITGIGKYDRSGLGLWCLTPLSTIFQLYRGS